MTKPTITLPTYTAAAFATATAALFSAGNSVAAAMTKAEAPKMAWARMAAVAICATDVAFTIEDVRNVLVEQAKLTLGVRKRAGINNLSDVKALGGGYATVAGWFYDLQKADKGGLLPLLLEGHSLTGLRRAVADAASAAKGGGKRATSNKSGGKSANDNPAPQPVKVPPSYGEVADMMEYDVKRLSAKQLRNPNLSQELARIIKAAAALAARIEAAKTPRVRKAVAKAA